MLLPKMPAVRSLHAEMGSESATTGTSRNKYLEKVTEQPHTVPFLLSKHQVAQLAMFLGVRLLPTKLIYKFIEELQ